MAAVVVCSGGVDVSLPIGAFGGGLSGTVPRAGEVLPALGGGYFAWSFRRPPGWSMAITGLGVGVLDAFLGVLGGYLPPVLPILFSFFSLCTEHKNRYPDVPQRYTGTFGERPPQTGLAFPREPFVPPSFRGPAKQASFVDIVSLPSSTLGRRGAYSLGLGPLARCHSRNVTLGYSRYEAGRLGSRFPRFVPVVAHTHTHIPIGPFPRILFLLSLVRESVP